MRARLLPDRFVLLLLATTLAAGIAPVEGAAVPVARGVATGAIVLLFFLNGVRLPAAEVRRGLADWRTQGSALLLCFGLLPTLGLGAALLLGPVLPGPLAAGFLFAGVLPSTVQSATAATTEARGDVAASIVSAALLNLVGVLAAPLLFAALLPLLPDAPLAAATAIDPLAMAGRVAVLLLIPFAIGQLARPWLGGWAARRRRLVTTLDRAAIAIAVYVAFSGAVVAGVWRVLDGAALAWLALGIVALLAAAMALVWWIAGRVAAAWPTRVALFFSGHQKSIAVGAPLAALLFPPALAGMLLLPILLYHLAQLILAARIAPLIARHAGRRVLSP